MDDFLFIENDWLYERYSDLEFVRSPKYLTFKAALNLFLQNNGKIIVETGTMRVKDDPSGCSTLLFGAFCKRYGKKLYTVDNNPQHIEISKQETREFRNYITYVMSDSVEFLSKFKEPIDLLYLDSMDCPVEGDATAAQQHQLNEIKAAYPNLHLGSIVLLDDNDFPNGGKTMFAKRYLLGTGYWNCILDHGQSLWIESQGE